MFCFVSKPLSPPAPLPEHEPSERSKMGSRKTCVLLPVPAEIRKAILELVFSGTTIKASFECTHAEGGLFHPYPPNWSHHMKTLSSKFNYQVLDVDGKPGSPSVLLTNRQLFEKGCSIFYQCACLEVDNNLISHDAGLNIGEQVSQALLRQVTNIMWPGLPSGPFSMIPRLETVRLSTLCFRSYTTSDGNCLPQLPDALSTKLPIDLILLPERLNRLEADVAFDRLEDMPYMTGLRAAREWALQNPNLRVVSQLKVLNKSVSANRDIVGRFSHVYS